MTEHQTTDLAALLAGADTARLAWLERHYEALARAECRRQGIDPDDPISDAGHVAWELVGYEAAQQEMTHGKR